MTETDRDPVLSAVIPVNNEEELIAELLSTVAGALAPLDLPFEICIVDDGSTDGSWAALEAQADLHPELRAVKLSRRFGKEAAILAGLQLARGKAAIVMDADLQHPPGLIPEMVRRWKTDGFQVVDALKNESAGTAGDRLHARMFYNLLAWFSGYRLHGSSDFKLLDRAVIDAYVSLGERGLFFRGMTDWLGFRHASVPFDVPPRTAGNSKWSLLQLARLALDSITTLSSMPLRLITGLGFFLLVFAVILGTHTLYRKLTGSSVDGFTTVILLQLIIGSALMVGLGVIGEYIARIFDEVKQRPRFIVERSLRSQALKGPPEA